MSQFKKYIACRVRDSIDLVSYFFDYYSDFDGFFFFDDHSTDGTRSALERNAKTLLVIDDGMDKWSENSWRRQCDHRNAICDKALSQIKDEDFLFLLDIDEYMVFDDSCMKDRSCIKLSLYDFVITEDDTDEPFYNREWVSTVKRDIVFGCRKRNWMKVESHRTIKTKGLKSSDSSICGKVKHYGRARSVERFDNKCDYYSSYTNYRPYVKKWSARKGNAVVTHDMLSTQDYCKWSDLP